MELDWILWLLLGVVIGVIVTHRFHVNVVQDLLKFLGYDNPRKLSELERQLAQQLDRKKLTPSTVIQIRLEQDRGVLYAYRVDTEEFLAQGTDQATLIEAMAQRFKGVTIEIINGEIMSKIG